MVRADVKVACAFLFVCGLMMLIWMDSSPRTVINNDIKLDKPESTPSQQKFDKHRITVTNKWWRHFFSFVPYGLMDCEDLFKGQELQDVLPSKYVEQYQNYSATVTKMRQTLHWKANEGYSAQHLEKHIVYHKLVQAPFIGTVGETGFNQGHSTLTWLAARNDTKVYSFDLGEHEYARPMAAYLQKQYPGRLEVTWGDSTKTLPDFIQANPDVKCDLIIIDGGHTTRVAQEDYNNFKKMANPINLLLFDDFPATNWGFMDELGPVWDGGKRASEIAEAFHCMYLKKTSPTHGHGFSIGSYII